jgi:Bacterial Ig-like domain
LGVVSGPLTRDLNIYLPRRLFVATLPSQPQLAALWRRFRQVFVVGPQLGSGVWAPSPPPSQRRPLLARATFDSIRPYVVTLYGPASRSTVTLKPAVASVTPTAGSTRVAADTRVYATFSQAVAPATRVFTVKRARDNRSVAGRIVKVGSISVFIPRTVLAPATRYIATVSAAANASAPKRRVITKTWSFRTK